jgi:hypothetical protein
VSHIIGWILLALGYVLVFLGGLWIIVLAWQRSVLWGAACLLLPGAQLVYVIAHWKESKEGFFLTLAGLALLILATIIGAPGR